MPRSGPLKVTLITGLPGSGKTTLITCELSRPDFPRSSTALILNEIGPLRFDARKLRGQAARIISLSAGCLCCSTPRQLTETLLQLSRHHPIRRVWIEASGSADPETLLERLTDHSLAEHVIVSTLVHVMDATTLASSGTSDAAQATPARLADRIILTHADQIPAETIPPLRQMVQRWNPPARILTTAHGNILPDHHRPHSPYAHSIPRHSRHSRTLFVPLPEPVPRSFLEMRLQELSDRLERAAGFVRLCEASRIHSVEFHPHHALRVWRMGSEQTSPGLTLTGRKLQAKHLRQHFLRSFAVTTPDC